MTKFLFISLLLGSTAFAAQRKAMDVTPVCSDYIAIQNNNAYNREQLKAFITTSLAQLATKADLAATQAAILAALQAPAPTPTPAPSVGGIFIGTTEYQHLTDAGAAYKAGDTIHITKSQDMEGTALVNGDVSVVCDPGVKLTWSKGINQRLPWGKAIFNVEGLTKNFSIANCEISGAQLDATNGLNGAAVRLNDGITSATLTNVSFHDNNDGILGAAKTTTISGSRFFNNGVGIGQDGHTHNVYFSSFADQVLVSDSYFGPVNQGNLFKSRAKATTCTRCVFDSFGQNGSYEIDIPNGGKTLIQNSVIYKAVGQDQHFMLSYGVEGLPADGRVNTYEFANNMVIADDTAHFMNGTGTFNFHDNKLVGPIDSLVSGTSNLIFTDRASAGLPVSPTLPAAK